MIFKKLPDESLSGRLCFLQKDFKLFCEQSLKPYGLTNGLYFYLIYLNKHSGCPLNELSTAFDVNKAHITRTITQLEQAGYVHKRPNPDDCRAYQLQVTASGEAVLQEIQNIFDRWDQAQMALFSPTDYKTLLKLFNQLEPLILRKENAYHV